MATCYKYFAIVTVHWQIEMNKAPFVLDAITSQKVPLSLLHSSVWSNTLSEMNHWKKYLKSQDIVIPMAGLKNLRKTALVTAT